MQKLTNTQSIVKKYRRNILNKMIEEKLLKAEEQIESGKTIKATEVFKELKEKYDF